MLVTVAGATPTARSLLKPADARPMSPPMYHPGAGCATAWPARGEPSTARPMAPIRYASEFCVLDVKLCTPNEERRVWGARTKAWGEARGADANTTNTFA